MLWRGSGAFFPPSFFFPSLPIVLWNKFVTHRNTAGQLYFVVFPLSLFFFFFFFFFFFLPFNMCTFCFYLMELLTLFPSSCPLFSYFSIWVTSPLPWNFAVPLISRFFSREPLSFLFFGHTWAPWFSLTPWMLSDLLNFSDFLLAPFFFVPSSWSLSHKGLNLVFKSCGTLESVLPPRFGRQALLLFFMSLLFYVLPFDTCSTQLRISPL